MKEEEDEEAETSAGVVNGLSTGWEAKVSNAALLFSSMERERRRVTRLVESMREMGLAEAASKVAACCLLLANILANTDVGRDEAEDKGFEDEDEGFEDEDEGGLEVDGRGEE